MTRQALEVAKLSCDIFHDAAIEQQAESLNEDNTEDPSLA